MRVACREIIPADNSRLSAWGPQPLQIETYGDVARCGGSSHQLPLLLTSPPFKFLIHPPPSLSVFGSPLLLRSLPLPPPTLAPVYRAIIEMISTVSQQLTDEAGPL